MSKVQEIVAVKLFERHARK